MAVRSSCSPVQKLEPLSPYTDDGFPLRLMNLHRALIKESVYRVLCNLDVNGSCCQTGKYTAIVLDMLTPLLDVQGGKIIHANRGEWWIFRRLSFLA